MQHLAWYADSANVATMMTVLKGQAALRTLAVVSRNMDDDSAQTFAVQYMPKQHRCLVKI